MVPLLSRFAARAALVTLRQTFVRRSHGSENCCRLGSGEAETGDARGRDGGVREELAAGVAPMTNHHHEEPAPLPALVWGVVFTILLVAVVAVFALVLSR